MTVSDDGLAIFVVWIMLKHHNLPNSTHPKPCLTKIHLKAIFSQMFALNFEKKKIQKKVNLT